MQKLPLIFCLLFSLSTLNAATACEQKLTDGKLYTISGYVKDSLTGEVLLGATVYITEAATGVSSNAYGFYSISLPAGAYTLRYTYVGYMASIKRVILASDQTFNIMLSPALSELEGVEITGKRPDDNIRKPEMSVVKLDVKTIARIPALLGEVDIIKAIQLLPGVHATSEGSSGFSVRGGSSDQNLIILDEATVYNASHLMGFFSIFNNDAIKDVTLYKGDIPTAYAGRLSSLLDVRMNDGNAKSYSATGGVGTISSRLTLEGPIIKDKTTFIASGRRTYADLFLPFAREKEIRDNQLFFYDLNLKLSHTFNENNRIYFSGYTGRDIFKNQFAVMGFGNQTASLRWNHLFSRKLFLNVSAIYSKFDYNLGSPAGNVSGFNWESGMQDHTGRLDFTYYLNPSNTIKFGGVTTFHEFSPGSASGLGDESMVTEFIMPDQFALEHGLYISNEQKPTSRLTLKNGLRISVFQNVGPGTYFRFNSFYKPIDSVLYKKRDFFNTYVGAEPRLAFTYLLDSNSSIKAHYSHTYQYLALAQNSTGGTPLDIWFPSTPNVKPQVSDQAAIGYFRNFMDHTLEASVEVYYKRMNQVIDFKDHASLLLNQYLEGELRIGHATSYGIEALFRKGQGKLNGWISYTYSRTFRTIPEINNGKKYPAPYDKPHSVNIVLNYSFSKRLEASAIWVYSTGSPVTFPTGRAYYGYSAIPVYSERNSYRMPDYHRLDLSVTLKDKEKPGKKWFGEWNLSVYNAYFRKNAWSINFEYDPTDITRTYAVKTYLFSIIPALTYNFKFKR